MEKITKTEAVRLLTENVTHFYGVTTSEITDEKLDNLLEATEVSINAGVVMEMRTATVSSKYYVHFSGGSSLDLSRKNCTALIVTIYYAANNETNRYKHLIYLVVKEVMPI